MAAEMLDVKVLKERMKEAFGSDNQETVAQKLCTTQGNISKLLTGKQMPTMDLVYLIAKNYKVSVDWLLGLSERKQPIQLGTYGSVVEDLIELSCCETLHLEEGPGCTYKARLDDPLLFTLLETGKNLRRTDWNSYKQWRDERLALFADKELIRRMIWREDSYVYNESCLAATEQDWLDIHEAAMKVTAEMLRDPY